MLKEREERNYREHRRRRRECRSQSLGREKKERRRDSERWIEIEKEIK